MKRLIIMSISLLLFVCIVFFGVKLINNEIDEFVNVDLLLDSIKVPIGAKTVEIYLQTDENCSVVGDNPVVIRSGGTAMFKIVFNENYQLDQSVGTYKNGTLYITDCTQSSSYSISSKTINDYYYYDYAMPTDFDGSVTSSKAPGKYLANQAITITANASEYSKFTGWSIGGTVLDGGTMISYSSTYTFRLSDNIKIYPNFLKDGYAVVKYHLNGGYLASDGITDQILTQVNTSIKECPNLMADTGEITREGYTLLEFTTNRDGSGTAINPGGLVDIPESGVLEVWAQWAQWTDASQFEYTKSGNEITIKKYIGDDSYVTIPEYINGLPVTTILSNAFVNKSFETLVLPKTIRKVQSYAFSGCMNFNTLYIFDTFTSIPDDAFANCKKFSNLRLNAGRNPSYSGNAESVATRLNYIMTRENYSNKPIILLVGGSSALFGFDSKHIEKLLNYEYYVINCGTNAGGCGMLYIEALSSFLREGDIVMNVPEYGNVQFADPTLYWRTFRATESCYNIFRYVDFSKYEKFFSAMSEFNSSTEARANLKEVSYETKNTSLTDFNCDLNRTRIYNNKTFSSISIHAGLLTAQRAENFNKLNSILTSKGIKYYIGGAPVYAYGFKSSDADVTAFVNAMRDKVDAPYISDPQNYKYQKELFYDSTYHLTTEGALLRSEQLVRDLLPYLY